MVLGEREGGREGEGLRGGGTWLALLGGGGALAQTPSFDWSCDFSSLELAADCSEAYGPFIGRYYRFIATWFLCRRALEAGHLIKQCTETALPPTEQVLSAREVGHVPGSVRDVCEHQSGWEQRVPVLIVGQSLSDDCAQAT